MADSPELYSTDAYRRSFDAAVVEVDRDAGRVALSRTVFYPGGGGQPHDLGVVRWDGGAGAVTKVKREAGRIWHWLDAAELPDSGVEVAGEGPQHRATDRRVGLGIRHPSTLPLGSPCVPPQG